MKILISILSLSFSLNYCFTQGTVEGLLTELDGIIEKREVYTQNKLSRLDSLKRELLGHKQEPADLFLGYFRLSSEYQTFNFDSAFFYTNKAIEVAYQTKIPDNMAKAKTEFGNILISSGMFKETMDTLLSIDLNHTSNEVKARFYTVLSRCYFELKSYAQGDYYSNLYKTKGIAAYDSAIIYYPDSSWQQLSFNAQKNARLGNNDTARDTYEKMINMYDLSRDQLAVEASALSFVYEDLNMPDSALKYMTIASIADFKGAKKEAIALMHVANAMYERGDINRASHYINIALDESNYYGSNLRLSQIAHFMPIIKSKHIQTIETQKKELLYYAIVVSVLSLIVFAFIFIVIKQYNRIKKTKKKVEDSYDKLRRAIEELRESNRIKEEYIGYYFSANSQMIEKLEAIKKSISRKYNLRRFDDIAFDLKNLDINRERENLFENFDRVFLKIFPDFIEKFNLLLNVEDKITNKDGQLMNTDLRIFALIRLGIHDNEKIAKILDYSVNTIYSYKTRIKNKSIYPNEKFERELMKIKHI